MPSLHTCTSPIEPGKCTAGQQARRLAALAFAILLCAALSTEAATSAFDCESRLAGTVEQQQDAVVSLMEESYDTDRLLCAVTAVTAIADAHPGDFSAQLAALRANTRYMYYLDRIILYELGYLIDWYVVEVPKEKKTNAPMKAMIAAREEQQRILDRARAAGFEGGELDYYQSFLIGPNAQALPLLKAAVTEDPPGLHGAAHALLAETWYALPDIAGGDLGLAIEMMRAALQRDPGNPRYARLLASYLLDKGQDDEARAVLSQILTMESGRGGQQLLADQLRAASDLAQRIGESGLARQLSARREAMLAENPYLQKRRVVSAMGHFGDKDPMENHGNAGDKP